MLSALFDTQRHIRTKYWCYFQILTLQDNIILFDGE